MLEGIYTSAAGMLPRTNQLEVIANNLANVSTAGFKRDRVTFRQTLDAELAVAAETGETQGAQEVVTDFSQGPLEKTDRPLDLAIDGEGFFVVQTAAGERYTRAGSFRLDAAGRIVTPDGYPVLGERGPIVLHEGSVEVRSDGEIWQKGVAVGRLRVVNFPNLRALAKEGHSLFRLRDPNVRPVALENVRIKQGYLEGSNVNALEEMVEMMVVVRNFEAEQKAIQTQDETLSRAINELPKL
ncbi:MAG: flagellar basal-body rod protein FlgF [candidate division KSB1 bacterium]|nr:flagellar basal-body rod protein FlgF [candidate division KSB1 bacterium]